MPGMTAPEHNHGPHAHGTGMHWLDMIVAVSVTLISVISLIVSIEHGRTMEKMVDQNQKMVEASTLPLLTAAGSDFSAAADKPMKRLYITNDGIGPAIIDRFEVRYKGVSYPTEKDLLVACCTAALPKESDKDKWQGIFYSNVSGLILSPHEKIDFIQIDPALAGKNLVQLFEQARSDLDTNACYCSVLDKCWETNFEHKRPTPVASCKVNPGDKLW